MKILLVLITLFSIDSSSLFGKDPLEVRHLINQKCLNTQGHTLTVASIQEITVELAPPRKTTVRVYTPEGEGAFPLILFIHGGAWVAGNLDTHDNLARYLCNKVRAIVVAVDYLNAPEGKFPYPLEQCYDALLWASHTAESKIAVVGDSAGGNMAAALCLMTRDRKGPKIAFQGLINPAPDLTCKGTLEPRGDLVDDLRWQASMYVKSPEEVYNPYVSPYLMEDFTDTPPAIVLLAEFDALYQDGLAFAEKLKAHGIPVTVYCQQNVNHLAAYGARAADLAIESLNALCSALNSKLW